LLSKLYDLPSDNLYDWVGPVSQTQFTQCVIEGRGYEATREATMAAFAKSWRRE
jgi:hypothetical protein